MKIIKIALFTICALSAYAPEALGGKLFDLVDANKIEDVQKYIEEQGNGEVNQANKDEKTPLYWACYHNNLEIVELLLKNGAKESVNKAGNFGHTPLYWACWNNNPEIVKLLLDNGAKESVNKANTYEKTPLYCACFNNNPEIVKLLLENGAKESVNKANTYEKTPLYCACFNNNPEIVKLLLENGAKESVNKANKNGETPLWRACYKDNLEMVKLLLENGAKESVNKAGNDGRTPLYWACWRNNLEMVKLLLENGADATTGVSGKKAIERICSSKWTTENRKKLLMSLLSVPEKGAENETEEQKKSRIFKELVVSSLAENMQQSSTIAPTISSNDGLHKSELVSNPEQVINQIETVVKFYLFTPFVRAPQKQDYLWPVVIGDKGSVGLEKSLFSLSLQRLKIGFGITHEHLMFLRNLQKSAQAYVKMGGKIVIPAKTMRKLCDLWFKFEYNNQ